MPDDDPRIRGDISKFLVHLTRDTEELDARDNLISILRAKKIEARNFHCLFSPKLRRSLLTPVLKNAFKTVCFTETPLDQIHKLTAENFPRRIRLKPYGLVFWRDALVQKGANPAIYVNGDGTSLREFLIAEFDRHFKGITALKSLREKEAYYKEIVSYYSLINLMSSKHDFSWEREWRHSGDFRFKYSEIVAIVVDDPEDFIEYSSSKLSKGISGYLKRIPVISANWTYEDVVEEMAIKIWNNNS
ncbi:abortive infection system antitoxin AbiGi family protein [Cerasicoccus maritimus]|uniref:abortive infection system antitoxin AbiGi family protein n=1 Tax=Cerasicoccus maritimus TaxID=490089 RepID=UPI002852AD0D|nr:abortive infection system antitoxin AbiGi family protein [Cerasicoccus maritimus]